MLVYFARFEDQFEKKTLGQAEGRVESQVVAEGRVQLGGPGLEGNSALTMNYLYKYF